jgi:dihydroorotate dehydrogenase (NAD+) catalytic subunit
VLPGSGVGGLSGPVIKPLALAAVAAVRAAVSIPVVGMGGITNTADAVDFFIAGADAIQVGTATFTDPMTAVRVVDGLEEYLSSTGLARCSELRWQSAQPGAPRC